MAIEVLPTQELLAVYADSRLAIPQTFWRDLGGFSVNVRQSTTEDIIFEKLDLPGREIAPFIVPNNTGRPIFKRKGSTAKLFRPAYIKPRDSVRPSEQFSRRPGDLFTAVPRTPQQNWDSEVAAILAKHREAIERRWEWMAAQAILYGQVTIDYLDGPSVTVDFDRDPSLTVIKTSNLWTDTYDILGDLQVFIDRVNKAPFGGIASRLTIGREVWPVMQKNEGLLKLMDLNVRGSNVNMERGLIPTVGAPQTNVAKVAQIGTLEVFLYSDFYQDDAGNQVDFMNPRDIVLTTGDVGGVMCFGAIQDAKAGLAPLPVFPKMWENEDPSAMYIMTQSAPLAVLPNPNRTFRARVVEEDSNSAGV